MAQENDSVAMTINRLTSTSDDIIFIDPSFPPGERHFFKWFTPDER